MTVVRMPQNAISVRRRNVTEGNGLRRRIAWLRVTLVLSLMLAIYIALFIRAWRFVNVRIVLSEECHGVLRINQTNDAEPAADGSFVLKGRGKWLYVPANSEAFQIWTHIVEVRRESGQIVPTVGAIHYRPDAEAFYAIDDYICFVGSRKEYLRQLGRPR